MHSRFALGLAAMSTAGLIGVATAPEPAAEPSDYPPEKSRRPVAQAPKPDAYTFTEKPLTKRQKRRLRGKSKGHPND